MNSGRTMLRISVLAIAVASALQAQNVVVVADSRGVSVEAEISYEDQRRFSDEIHPVFRVYEYGSDSIFVDVPTKVDPNDSTFEKKRVKGRVTDRIESVGEVELVTFFEKL